MILRLQGGLGNQIFQLLALRYIATVKSKEKFIYPGDLRHFKTKRDFALSFLLSDEKLIQKIPLFDQVLFRTKLSKALAIAGVHSISSVKQISSWKSQILNGYFQDIYNYPDYSLVKTLVQEFQLQMAGKKNTFPFIPDACAIHLRLTDFIRTPQQRQFLLSFRIPYIQRAIEWFKSSGTGKFILFTDDMVAAKQLLRDDDIIPFNQIHNDKADLVEEFSILSSFSNLICSNSTFSFWASMLGVPKKVVFPLVWDKLNKSDERNFQANLAVYDKVSILSNQLIRL